MARCNETDKLVGTRQMVDFFVPKDLGRSGRARQEGPRLGADNAPEPREGASYSMRKSSV